MKPRSIVRRIDHVWIPVADPSRILDFLTEVFGLPIAWPLQSYGEDGLTGAVFAGNLNIEALRLQRGYQELHCAPDRLQIVGVAFEPEPIASAEEELRRRGIPYRGPYENPGYTNIHFYPGLPGNVDPFLCEYRGAVKVESSLGRRPTESEYYQKYWSSLGREANPLESVNGGPLGIQRLVELILGATDPEATRAQWQHLFDPIQPVDLGLWHLGWGPSFRVVPADHDGVTQLKIQVRSVDEAARFLETQGMIASRSEDEVLISPDALFGLEFALTRR